MDRRVEATTTNAPAPDGGKVVDPVGGAGSVTINMHGGANETYSIVIRKGDAVVATIPGTLNGEGDGTVTHSPLAPGDYTAVVTFGDGAYNAEADFTVT